MRAGAATIAVPEATDAATGGRKSRVAAAATSGGARRKETAGVARGTARDPVGVWARVHSALRAFVTRTRHTLARSQ